MEVIKTLTHFISYISSIDGNLIDRHREGHECAYTGTLQLGRHSEGSKYMCSLVLPERHSNGSECDYIDTILTGRHGEGSEYAYTVQPERCKRSGCVYTRTIQQERHGEGYELFLEKITKCDWTISLTTN